MTHEMYVTQIRLLQPCKALTKRLLAHACFGVQVGTPSQYKAARSGNAGGIHYGAVDFRFNDGGEVAFATVAHESGAKVRQLSQLILSIAQGEGIPYEVQSTYEPDL